MRVVGILWLAAVGYVVGLSAAAESVGRRPYELDWAGRMADDRPPLVDFEEPAGWHVECEDALATFERTREQQLWGNYVGKLERTLFFDNLAVFTEQFPPLTFEPRPRRGIEMLPGESAGANTGPGVLPFPTGPHTILPRNLARHFTNSITSLGDGYLFLYEGSDARGRRPPGSPGRWSTRKAPVNEFWQDQSYRPAENPWLVDFDLRQMHDLGCNFGMGNLDMFYANRPRPHDTPEERDAEIDRFLAATVAFGHPGFLVMEGGMGNALRSYFMLQQLQSRYCLTNAAQIRYATGDGRLLDRKELKPAALHSENGLLYVEAVPDAFSYLLRQD